MAKRRALIVKFGQIGDVIMALPAAWALHQKGYAIDWVCGRAANPLLACYSWIRVLPIDDKAILRGRLPARLAEVLHLWRLCGARRYDLCATLYFDRRFHWLTAPLRAQRKVSLTRSRREATLLPGRHHTDECVRVLLDQPDGCREQSTPPVRPDYLPASPLARLATGPSAAARVALVPGGASNVLGEQTLRRWPIDKYVALAQLLLERDCEVLLLGGPEDAWVQPHFADLAVTDYVGTLPLPEVVSLCDTCDAVITHDTGPLHLAGLSTACIVGIFGPVDPSTRVPRRNGVVGIWGGQGFACRPCYDGRDFAPCRFNGCMHQVTPELVLRELDRLLSARSQGVDRPWHIVSPGDP